MCNLYDVIHQRCHLTADEESRKACMAANCIQIVAGKLEAAWLPWVTSNDPRADAALVQSATTACGVLLNILILDGAAAARHPAMTALANCLLANVGTQELTYGAKPILVANAVVVCFRVLLHTPCENSSWAAMVSTSQWDCFAAGIHPFLVAGLAAEVQGDQGFAKDVLDLWHLAVQSLPDACRRLPALHAALKATAVYTIWEKAVAAGDGSRSGRGGSGGGTDDGDDALPSPNVAVADTLARLHF